MKSLILGIETSCDETAAAVVDNRSRILSNVISSQIETHSQFGGIVPELASRYHLENITPVVQNALRTAGITIHDIDAIAVTIGPGLIGALLVGLSTAKSISYSLGKPIIGINHLEGHIFSVFLKQPPPSFPLVALIVSGGHTDLYLVRGIEDIETLGRTRDDAAGECFDKAARIMGLGYPGGPVINQLASRGNPGKIKFPRPMLSNHSCDFSFSGLKTSLKTYLASNPLDSEADGNSSIHDVSASFQEALVDVLVSKTLLAAKKNNVKSVVVAGGVACNTRLRERLCEECEKTGMDVYIPENIFCTDNAAMIALAGHGYRDRGLTSREKGFFALDANANLKIEDMYA